VAQQQEGQDMTDTDNKVKLMPADLAMAKAHVDQVTERYDEGGINALPWSEEEFTPESLRGWLENRKAAALRLDIKTCEWGNWMVDIGDVYGLQRENRVGCDTRQNFVRSAATAGWIWEGDLPKEKLAALRARSDRHNMRQDVDHFVQVRTQKQPDGDLIVWAKDRAEDIFMLVIGQAPQFNVVGGIRGKDARRDEWWDQDFEAWFVPQKELQSPSILKSLPKLAMRAC
jgi:hypothetical protein